mmetsp:Transcript_30511/g.71664  ORF Transcript_30511/g.71664 Transcript_30511/m.71664 type:complete len:223 (+) Transcript_30511:2455-3123(+)
MILYELEQKLHRPLGNVFQLMAGTSTGAIIAGALGVPDQFKQLRSTKIVLDLYLQHGSDIFGSEYMHVLTSRLRKSKYSARGLEKILEQEFGDSRLTDAVSNLLITACTPPPDARTHEFKSRAAKDGLQENFFMRDVLRATSAARGRRRSCQQSLRSPVRHGLALHSPGTRYHHAKELGFDPASPTRARCTRARGSCTGRPVSQTRCRWDASGKLIATSTRF